MEELLNKVNELIDKSTNVPEDIKSIVKAICRGYIRETNGMIPMSGIINVCETTFKEIDPDDKEFAGEDRILGKTDTNYDEDGKVKHGMSYTKQNNYIKLITILTHELGHVITEHSIYDLKDGKCPIIKKTGDFYTNCIIEDDELKARGLFGFRVTDGFLESISSRIFLSDDFRRELLEAGYDLEDYEYKDERLFPSRVYDEYRACFELFDYIMDGALTEFCSREFTSNDEIIKFINENKLSILYGYIDKSNDALWSLKRFEGREWSEEFNSLLRTYMNEKNNVINLAYALLGVKGKSEDDRFKELLNTYKSCLSKQKELPIPEDILRDSMKLD